MNIEIWQQGYCSSDGSDTASLIGEYDAPDFSSAVEMYLNDHPEQRKHYTFGALTKTHKIWGCKLYDNETQARSFFG